MQLTSYLGPDLSTLSASGSGVKKEQAKKDSANFQTWLKQRRDTLNSYNRDNVVFESGTIKMRGNEKVKMGRYLNVNRSSGKTNQYYVVSVEQEFMPFQGYFTTVQYERGTGFIDRQTTDNGSPYLSENDLSGFK